MRRLLFVAISMVALAGIAAPGALAQADAQFPGIERAIVRVYMFPSTESLTVTGDNDAGTPTSETVVLATPELGTPDTATVSAVVFMSVAVFDFDSDDHAQAGYDSIAQSLQATRAGDARFANAESVPLDGIGQQSSSVAVAYETSGVPLSLIDSVVRDGQYVYVVQGTLVRLDGKTELTRMMQLMPSTEPEEGMGAFVPSGTSTSGLWQKLFNLNPVLADGSDVFDAVLFPVG